MPFLFIVQLENEMAAAAEMRLTALLRLWYALLAEKMKDALSTRHLAHVPKRWPGRTAG